MDELKIKKTQLSEMEATRTLLDEYKRDKIISFLEWAKAWDTLNIIEKHIKKEIELLEQEKGDYYADSLTEEE